jgi:hypothetical protein
MMRQPRPKPLWNHKGKRVLLTHSCQLPPRIAARSHKATDLETHGGLASRIFPDWIGNDNRKARIGAFRKLDIGESASLLAPLGKKDGSMVAPFFFLPRLWYIFARSVD